MGSELLDSTIAEELLKWDREPQNPLSLSKVVAVFAELSEIYRPSYGEDAVREWIIASAQAQNCSYRVDKAGNLVVYVPACKQAKATETLILQAHLDMVCTNDGCYDWSQGVQLQLEDGWLKGRATSLGADDGAGVAMMVQLLRSHQFVAHPPLELLFTVAEEVGLKGALALEPHLLQGHSLLNLDSSNSESFTDGGAGGKSYLLEHAIKRHKNTEQGWRLLLAGLPGGHSGAKISSYENNALLLAYRCYLVLKEEFENFELCDLQSGEVDNMIPSRARLDFTVQSAPKNATVLNEIIKQKLAPLLDNERLLFPNLTWELEAQPCATILDRESAQLLKMLPLLPNATYLYNHQRQMPELSANLAALKMEEERLTIRVSARFARFMQLEILEDNIQSVAELFDCKLTKQKFYPSWPSVENSPLRELALTCYKKLFQKEAKVYSVHGGLEPGVILERLRPRKVDALSLGPTAQGLHTTGERLSLVGYSKTLQLLQLILKELADIEA